MNNIAIQNRTETGHPVLVLDNHAIRTALGFVILATLWVTPIPFQGGGALPTGVVQHGNLANQVSYAGLMLLALAGMMMLVDYRHARHALPFGWLLMSALVVLSGFTAPDSASAIRSVAFALAATTAAASVVFLAPSARGLSQILLASSVLLLVLCYGGVFLMPEAAIHQASEAESIHAGLWRGVFAHKNTAGPVMAAVAFIGIYLVRREWRISGAIVALAAGIFLWHTGSKTSVALVPAVVLMISLPAVLSMRIVGAVAVVLAVAAIHALTVGTVFVPFFDDILRAMSPDTSFTGRIEIWELARDFITRHPLTGFGYDSFWLSPITANSEQPFDRVWDPRDIVTGHNGFLDLALFMGFPALTLGVWLFVLVPAWQYVRTPRLRENMLLADLCLMIVAFTVMNSALESFFFRRADPVWLTLVVALFGLRLCSRAPIPSR